MKPKELLFVLVLAFFFFIYQNLSTLRSNVCITSIVFVFLMKFDEQIVCRVATAFSVAHSHHDDLVSQYCIMILFITIVHHYLRHINISHLLSIPALYHAMVDH